MLPKLYCGFMCFVALSINPIKSTAVFYKLVGNDVDIKLEENVPFLIQSFFSCGSSDDCTEVANGKQVNQFKEVTGKETIGEDSVMYKKIKTPDDKEQTWSAWSIVSCSVKCGGGNRTLVRHCYSHIPCRGKSSKVENCSTEGCPDLQKSKNLVTAYSYWEAPKGLQPGASWYPLLHQKPSCNGSEGDVLTDIKLEVNGTDIRYNYSCCKFKDHVCSKVAKSTLWDDDGDGLVLYIDRHLIFCGNFSFISSFQLERMNSQIRYSYTCCELFDRKWQSLTQCFDKSTAYVPNNERSIFTWPQIPVACDPGFGLSSLLLKRDASWAEWKFEFRCCKVVY